MSETAGNESNLQTLRGHLFDTLKDLRNPDKPMDLDRAKVVAEVAQTIVNSAKVEVDYLKVTGQSEGTNFLKAAFQRNTALPAGTKETAPGVREHRLK